MFVEHGYAIKMLYASKIRMRCVLIQKLVYENFHSIRECKLSNVTGFILR